MPLSLCEPNIDQLLADPLVGRMMRADRVEVAELDRMLRVVARRLEPSPRPTRGAEAAPRREAGLVRALWSRERGARGAGARIGCCG